MARAFSADAHADGHAAVVEAAARGRALSRDGGALKPRAPSTADAPATPDGGALKPGRRPLVFHTAKKEAADAEDDAPAATIARPVDRAPEVPAPPRGGVLRKPEAQASFAFHSEPAPPLVFQSSKTAEEVDALERSAAPPRVAVASGPRLEPPPEVFDFAAKPPEAPRRAVVYHTPDEKEPSAKKPPSNSRRGRRPPPRGASAADPRRWPGSVPRWRRRRGRSGRAGRSRRRTCGGPARAPPLKSRRCSVASCGSSCRAFSKTTSRAACRSRTACPSPKARRRSPARRRGARTRTRGTRRRPSRRAARPWSRSASGGPCRATPTCACRRPPRRGGAARRHAAGPPRRRPRRRASRRRGATPS